MIALLFGFAVQHIPVPAEPIKVPSPRFDDAWHDTMRVIPERTRKGDRLQIASAEANPVVTERILAPDVPARAPPVILVSDDGDTPTIRRHRRKLHMDVCMKHKMHRVETHGGRSWRCRK